MNLSSISSAYPSGKAAAAASGEKQLEAQVSSLTSQVEATERDKTIDCNEKEARVKALQAQLQRAEAQLAQARAKAAEGASNLGSSTPSRDDAEQKRRARADEAKSRGGIDVFA
jgi:chromosome segregation ATPase